MRQDTHVALFLLGQLVVALTANVPEAFRRWLSGRVQNLGEPVLEKLLLDWLNSFLSVDEQFRLLAWHRGGQPLARHPRLIKPVVNVSSYSIQRLVLSGLFPLAYAAVLTCLLLQAFRMMRLSSASAVSAPSDRTGLKTIHPELLDENGVMTNEELWAVRFSEKEGVVLPEA